MPVAYTNAGNSSYFRMLLLVATQSCILPLVYLINLKAIIMKVKKRTESVDLVADGSDNVIVTITIGNAQIGGSVVKIKNTSTVIGKGEIQNLNLGTKAELKGKTITITTNILDTNEQTNGVVVTYFFHACTVPVTTFNDKVDNDGDIFSFIVDFNF